MKEQHAREARTFPTGELVYKKEAAKFLGISLKTLDRYVADGRLLNWKNEVNGRVYYDKQDLLKLLGSRLPQSREVWVYSRAAPIEGNNHTGTGAKARLAAQTARVLQYCQAAGVRVAISSATAPSMAHDRVRSRPRAAGRTSTGSSESANGRRSSRRIQTGSSPTAAGASTA